MSFKKLSWESGLPRTVLVIKKINDISILSDFVTLIDWLVNTEHLNVVVESKVLKERALMANSTFYNLQQELKLFNEKESESVDLIMTLGGDGTLLYTASLFPGQMPPVVPFCHGSLGFLTPHKFQNYQQIVFNVISGKSDLTVRARLKCDLSDDDSEETLVMNEVVISRNQSSSMSYIDLHIDGEFVTSVQGDGLMLSTATGSTAYAASAGSSLVHPSVGGILVVPINSHSLSSRPVLVPAGVELRVTVSPSSRDNSVQCSFDGRGMKQINKGQSLTVATSDHHVPCVAAKNPNMDWFTSLKKCLQWNERKPQKYWEDPQDELEEQSEENEEIQTFYETFACKDHWNMTERLENQSNKSKENLTWSSSDSGNGSI